MLKTITKVGNSQGLIFDTALVEMTGLKIGDHVNITVHDGGTIVITPIRKAVAAEAASTAIRKVAKDYRKTLRRLA
jgi:antitoxin component of MazEF toxin-antitoxin module